MSFQKYRLRDVASDFGTNAKEISEIVGKYFEKPKNNTQVLSDEELNVVFDRMTHAHQIDSLEQVFAVKPKEQPKAAAPAEQNKPAGTGARFNSDGSLMFVSSSCEDKKKGFTISDLSDTSFTVRVWSEKDEAFIQREISINDIIQ